MKLNIRQYDPKLDAESVFKLWQENFGEHWPLELAIFNQIISSGDHFVETDNQKITGFIATQTTGEKASILTIIGENKELLNFAIQYLKSKQVKQIQLGDGGNSYFWPGIPTNLPRLMNFFEANNWQFTEDSYDLVGDVHDYQTPVNLGQAKIEIATQKNIKNILEFENKNFPEWHSAYKHKADLGDFDDMFYAEDDDKKIAGTVFIFSADSYSAKEHQIWKQLLGEDMGGICCLGVREDMRKKGIGLAIAAYASEKLKVRKAGNVFVGYTWLVDWYGKLGYKIWRQYKMSWKQL